MRRRAGAAQEVPLQVSVKPIVSPIIASDMTLWSRFVVASFIYLTRFASTVLGPDLGAARTVQLRRA